MAKPTRAAVWNLMAQVGAAGARCPCHAPVTAVRKIKAPCPTHGPSHHHHHKHDAKGFATANEDTDYAFEMAASNIRYGPGVTREVGMDMMNLGAKKVAVFTDPGLAKLQPVQTVLAALKASNVNHVLFPNVRIEPSDKSFKEAIDFVRKEGVDSFIAVGGGSVIDTAKAANLYLSHPDAAFLDFVNAPIGKGKVPTNPVKPLIAIPTTAGTGSETTGVAIFDFKEMNAKTGIAHRSLKPLLGIVDPINTRTMPPQVHVASGLDVLCHALESYTAIPYNLRSPRPTNPLYRPAYQGSNPISDMWSLKALKMCIDNLPGAYRDPNNHRAQEQMILASTFAGIGFGNAGVHLCHGMSYPIAGGIFGKGYHHPGYPKEHEIVPHGISVAITSPAVFNYTAPACPDRHLEAAALFGVDISNAKLADAGPILADALRSFLNKVDVPNGLTALGYNSGDIPKLVQGTLPQHRVTKLAPLAVGAEEIQGLIEKSMELY
ncbi:alcohol dehydrogenase [Phlyctochytrium arcticum]|nr:alcohol dehydrogenase [Phlyctochytrium arcticum]